MPQFTPEQLDQRRQRMAEAEGLGGWYLTSLCDGQDATTGEHLSWHEYRHLDGRRATVGDNGRATDPDLQAQLDSRAKALAAGPTPTVAAGVVQRRRWMALRWLPWAWIAGIGHQVGQLPEHQQGHGPGSPALAGRTAHKAT